MQDESAIPVAILGGGGHAKVVISALRASGRAIFGVFDDDPTKVGGLINGAKVIGPIVSAIDYPGITAIVAIGDNRRRRQVAEAMPLRWTTAVDPTAIVDSSVKIGEGTIVASGAIIQPDVSIGCHVIVNSASLIGHDSSISDYAHVSGGTCLGGGVTVGRESLVGLGVCVAPGVAIGRNATVWAGAVVSRDVEHDSHVISRYLGRATSAIAE